MKKAMRFDTLDFINIGTGEAEEWALMGGSLTSWTKVLPLR